MLDDRSYLKVLFDHFPTGVIVADDHAVFVDVNQAACQLLDRTRDQIVSEHLSTIVAPGRAADVNLQWQSFIRDGSQQGIFEVALTNGTTRQVMFNARADFMPGLHCSFLTAVTPSGPTDEAASDLLTVCAWSKRVLHEGEWLTIEEYLLLAHGLFVTHGISPGAFTEASKPKRP